MQHETRNQSLKESRTLNKTLSFALLISVLAILGLTTALLTQSKIIVQQTPGMPSPAVIEKSNVDKGTQRAILIAVTSNISQVNPANAEYQKVFLQSFLAPAVYTKISLEVDQKVRALVAQRELGSYYFVFTRYEYDPALDRHFVLGEVHTVNAAKDTLKNYVFEYKIHTENYRTLVDDIVTYDGDRPHDSTWKKDNM